MNISNSGRFSNHTSSHRYQDDADDDLYSNIYETNNFRSSRADNGFSLRSSSQKSASETNPKVNRKSTVPVTTRSGTKSSSTAGKSKVYQQTNIWGLLEQSYRAQDEVTSGSVPKLYFDGGVDDSFHSHEAIEITGMSTASRSKSYLKQLEDYLLEKESEETDNIPFRRSSQSKSSQKPLASNTSSKPKVRESLSKDTTKTKITKSKSNNPQPKYEYASDLLNTKSSHESSLNYSIDISSLPNEVGGMTLEELAHLPLDLSNSSHLDIIDSEINALYESGVDQPRQISSSSSSTRLHSSTLKRQKSNPTLPTVASKEFHNSNIPPPAPVDLSQAKSSLSLLKSKIKQANQNTRVIKKELTQSSGSTNDFENVVPAVVVAPIPLQDEDDEEFDENIPSAPTSTYQRIPLPGVTVGKPIPPNDPRGFPLATSEIQNEKQTSATSRKPQSLQEILQRKQNSSNPNNLPMQSEMAERMKNASNTLTSSYASNPYENDQFEEDFEEDDANLPQEECPDCGRKFNQNAFEKHVKICKKVFMQKRKKFDSVRKCSCRRERSSTRRNNDCKATE